MPVPLRPARRDSEPLDMSASSLRSVSPLHLQYLANMGVAASASFSVVIDGRLWGLIACHNETPRALTYDVHSAGRALAGSLAREIKAKDEKAQSSRGARGGGFVHDAAPWTAGVMATSALAYPAQQGWHAQRVDLKLGLPPQMHVKTQRGKYKPLRRHKSKSHNDPLAALLVGALAAVIVDAVIDAQNDKNKDSRRERQAGGSSRKDAVATRSVPPLWL